MRPFLIILLIFLSFFTSAQDLTGTWVGSASGNYAKLCIVRYNNTYIGYTYDEGMGHCTCNFLGEFNVERKKLKGMNKGVIEKTALHSQSRYNLNYVIIGGQEYLRGTVSAKSLGNTLMSFGLPMPISYTRSSQQTDTTEYVRKWLAENVASLSPDTVQVIAAAPVTTAPVASIPTTIPEAPKVPAVADSIITEKNKRVTDTISVINTSAKELLIKVMDNGVVDGDIVSIIHNGKVIAERIAVTTTPYELKIPIGNENEQQEIVLVAHNTGSIPPNTALIIIDTPSQQYRLTASTDLSKNAMIIFKYKPVSSQQ